MAKSRYKVRKKGGKRVVYGKSRERCCQCGELDWINHTKCAWCHQPLCYKYAFGIVFLDCEYGMIQRRDRTTGEIRTAWIPPHMCQDKKLTILHGSEFHQRLRHSMIEWHLYWQYMS